MKSMRFSFIIISAFLTALLFNHYWCYRNYTLAENGNWKSSKTELKKGVVAAWSTMFTKATLAGNKVDIASWHGYQEFTYKKPLAVGTIQFDVMPNGNVFSLLLHKSDSLTYGVRFSKNGEHFFFITQNSGAFLFKKSFGFSDSLIQQYSWNTIGFDMNQSRVTLYVNEQKVDSTMMSLPALLKPGMKGDIAFRSVFIDNIKAWDGQGRIVLHETFTPAFKFYFLSVLVFILFVVLGWYLSYKFSLQYALYILSVVVLCFVIYYAFYFYKASSYFNWGDNYINWNGVEPNHEGAESICERLMREFPIATSVGLNKIMFIGTSQTWGAGASSPQKTMPALIDKYLRDEFPIDSFTIINTGIPESEAPALWDLYKKQWSKHRPQLVVINLSTNDYDTTAFRSAIRSFLAYNYKHQINTLLIEEPNDVVTERLAYNHQIVRTEAMKYEVKCLSVQQQIDSAGAGGFLWWDYVHFTDFGYEVLAGLVYPSIIEYIDASEISSSLDDKKIILH
jgi:lysophospholipase L1-like esterase